MAQPRLLFVVMSAVHSARSVDELASALAPHTVLVHHDFVQTPEFELASPNACFVPRPKRTGWADWGFTEGIFRSLDHALETHPFDYLQLLSPTCLPIQPIRAFEQHVCNPSFDAHYESVDVLENEDALLSVGYRALAPERSLRHRVLRHLSWQHHRGGERAEQYPVAGVSLYRSKPRRSGPQRSALGFLARPALRAFSHRSISRHVFDERFRPSFGSVWFGARRSVVIRMAGEFRRPEVQRYMSRLHIADEFVVPTLLRISSVSAGPLNHLVKDFRGAHPGWLDASDFPRLESCGKYFARKFRDDAADPLRQRVLRELTRPDRVATPNPA